MERSLQLVLVLLAGLLAGRAWATEPADPGQPAPPRDAWLVSQDAPPEPPIPPIDAAMDAPADAVGGCPACGACGCCDCKKCRELNERAANAYKPLFYDNDFSYLNDPCYSGGWIGDGFKQLHHGCATTLDLGGQYRARYHHENNMRGLGLTGRDDDFLLHRTRVFANLKVGNCFRAYVEYIDATSEFQHFPPRPIEVNRSDLLNAFGDALLYEDCSGKLWGRVGRQELLYGVQRTVSPLDWANTRRTFDGAKLFWRGRDWDVDAFVTRPVFPNARQFDNPDNSQQFVGVYSTYKGWKDRGMDLYFLRYAEDAGAPDFDFNTFGARYYGSNGPWLWDLEAAYQTGNYGAAGVSAGAYTLGFAHAWKCAPAKPKLWIYYDWASGDANQGAGYNHLFPLSHKYLGFMDFFGRRNIQDLNLLLETQPHKRLKFLAWMHAFWLQNRNDIPYSVVMGPSPAPGFAVVPGGSKELGQELDLLAVWTINERMNLLGGYSHFWTGDWFRTNPTPGLFTGDANFAYTQFTVNF